MALIDLSLAARLFLDTLIQKETVTMPTQFSFRLYFSCPSAGPAMAALTDVYEITMGRGVGTFGLPQRLAPDANSGQTHWLGDDRFTAVELAHLRPRVSPNGTLYELGIRARRALNDAIETPGNEQGKSHVNVYEVGDNIPPGLDWKTGRVTEARFLADQSLVILEDAILLPASPAPR